MQHISEAEFLKAYDDYADAIYRHCFFRVFSKPQAEELVQETFLKTWEYLQSGKKVDNLRPFLYRVAGNLIIDRSRKKKEDSLEDMLENSPALEPADNDLSADIEQEVMAKEVRRIIDELPEDERRLITLRYVDELSPKEIATVLNLSPNHVSVKLGRAMKVLRSHLENSKQPWNLSSDN